MEVLMIAFMNKDAVILTLGSKLVTFYSRSKQRLWTKGETSGNFLSLIDCVLDCDKDSLLIYVSAAGPTCHQGSISCFDSVRPPLYWLAYLAEVIKTRAQETTGTSYTRSLLSAPVKRVAQKVGEEGVEVALAAVCGSDEEVCGEAVDLLYHLLVLLEVRKIGLQDVAVCIRDRSK